MSGLKTKSETTETGDGSRRCLRFSSESLVPLGRVTGVGMTRNVGETWGIFLEYPFYLVSGKHVLH